MIGVVKCVFDNSASDRSKRFSGTTVNYAWSFHSSETFLTGMNTFPPWFTPPKANSELSASTHMIQLTLYAIAPTLNGLFRVKFEDIFALTHQVILIY